MYSRLEPSDGTAIWRRLPVAHDMDLIGLAPYAICSVSPPWGPSG